MASDRAGSPDRPRTLSNPDASNPEAATTGTWEPERRLYSDGVFPGVERPVLAPVGSTVQRIPGTPFLDPATGDIPGALSAGEQDVAGFRAKIGAARIPTGGGRYVELARTALLDTYGLMRPNGAVQGAGSPYWAFVWPRDNSLVVVAFALLELYSDAWAALRYVYAMQEPDGQWEARYLPDGSGAVPDQRGRQDDGIGYTLWATWVTARLAPPEIAASELDALREPILRAVRAGCAVLDTETGLPRTSQDFWEMDQPEPSLGVAGPLAFGLRAGADLADELGAGALAAQARSAADALLAAVARTYGPSGFQHFPSGGGRDASVAFLLPPFLPETVTPSGARAAWDATRTSMRVANGGLRPGEEWPDEETGWNTLLSVYAIAAAALGERTIAEDYLDWMDARRTRLGCLPEKITADGQPAAVAPICTVTSGVLIALALLDGHTLPVAGA